MRLRRALGQLARVLGGEAGGVERLGHAVGGGGVDVLEGRLDLDLEGLRARGTDASTGGEEGEAEGRKISLINCDIYI